MEGFKVFEFTETKDILSLPVDWVINGQVRFNKDKFLDYVKLNKKPYKKWKIYNVRPLNNITFKTYNECCEAGNILLDKTDLDSSDIVKIKYKKKVTRRTDQNISRPVSSNSTSDNEFCLPSPPAKPKNLSISEDIVNNEVFNCTKDDNDYIQSYDVNRCQYYTLKDFDNLKNDILEKLSQVEENLKSYVDIKVNEMLKALKTTKQNVPQSFSAHSFKEQYKLPFHTIDDILQFETKLQDDDLMHEFESYLKLFVGRNLKESVKMMAQVYTLDLQAKVNFTGREGKLGLQNLKQTKIIIEVLMETCKQSEPFVKDEIKYYLQHVGDRIKSQKRNDEKWQNKSTILPTPDI